MDFSLEQLDIKSLISNGFGGFVGGLAGAFFAFVFIQVNQVITKRRESFVTYFNSLVTLEHYLNERMIDIDVNKYVLAKFVEGMKDINEENIILFWSIPRRYKKDSTILTNLKSLQLKNQLIDLFDEFDRMNDDINSNINHYSTTRKAFISNLIKPLQTVKSTNAVSVQFEYIIRGHEFLDKRIIRTLAFVRVLLRKDKPIALVRYYRKRNSKTVSEEEIRVEQVAVEKEIEFVRKASLERIEYIFGKTAD